MFWRRYGRLVGRGILAGALGGGILGLLLYAVSNVDYRARSGWGAFFYLVGIGAGGGTVTAIGALIGGFAAVLICDRSFVRPDRSRVIAGSIGAGSGAMAIWLGVALVNAAISPGGAGFFGIILMIALAATVVSIVIGATLLHRAERTIEQSGTEIY